MKYLFQFIAKLLQITVRHIIIGPLVYFFVFIWTLSRIEAEAEWKKFQMEFDQMTDKEKWAVTGYEIQLEETVKRAERIAARKAAEHAAAQKEAAEKAAAKERADLVEYNRLQQKFGGVKA